MPKDDIVYLGHMLDMARKVFSRVEQRTKEDFDLNEDLRFAVAHLIQTIGEAAARVSTLTKQAHPTIPWKQITGIRHRIVHDYMGVDYDIIWETANRDVPTLIAALEEILLEEEA